MGKDLGKGKTSKGEKAEGTFQQMAKINQCLFPLDWFTGEGQVGGVAEAAGRVHLNGPGLEESGRS